MTTATATDVPSAMMANFPLDLPAGSYMAQPMEAPSEVPAGMFGFTLNGTFYLCGLSEGTTLGLPLSHG